MAAAGASHPNSTKEATFTYQRAPPPPLQLRSGLARPHRPHPRQRRRSHLPLLHRRRYPASGLHLHPRCHFSTPECSPSPPPPPPPLPLRHLRPLDPQPLSRDLSAIHGPSLLALWNASTGRCVWKYDAAPEFLSCIRHDPIDARHLCTLDLRGFLLSIIALGDGEDEVSVQEHRIGSSGDLAEPQKLEREASPNAPALAVFPLYAARFCFSPRWRHILIATFPKELIVFDLQYGTALSASSLPRGCSKFMDLVPDPELDLLYFFASRRETQHLEEER